MILRLMERILVDGKKEERELKILCELMENSRKSDRDIAKNLGVSQPRVSRIGSRLEKEGYIKEYTLIPEFGKLARARLTCAKSYISSRRCNTS